MNTLFTGQHIIRLDSVDSTNKFAANLIKQTNWTDGTVILAEEQTEGKGRHQRTWQSERGKSLTCSYIFKNIQLSSNQLFLLNMCAGIAVRNTLEHYLPTQSNAVKWPNDAYCNGKKLAGVLTETSLRGSRLQSAIIGIGINVFTTHMPTAWSSSLQLEGSTPKSIEEVLSVLSSELEATLLALRSTPQQIVKTYNSFLFGKEKKMDYLLLDGTECSASILNVNADGYARFDLDGEEQLFDLDEIKLIQS